MSAEIERKFLMSPDFYDYLTSHGYLINKIEVVNQIYLSNEKDIRIRRSDKISYHVDSIGGITHFRPNNNAEYSLTYKTGKGLQRSEYTSEIDSLTFDILSELQVNELIMKTRYTLNTGEEIDIYKETDLIVMEMEFDSVEESENFVNKFEEFTVKEITDDEHYKNRNIAKWIIPY